MDISLKNISELKNNNFWIPTYQRGYRWTEQQVSDLLNDIKEFIDRKPSEHEIYCLQPLVVKKRNEDTLLRKIKEEATSLQDVETLFDDLVGRVKIALGDLGDELRDADGDRAAGAAARLAAVEAALGLVDGGLG